MTSLTHNWFSGTPTAVVNAVKHPGGESVTHSAFTPGVSGRQKRVPPGGLPALGCGRGEAEAPHVPARTRSGRAAREASFRGLMPRGREKTIP
jgi:hypothetical protein